MYVYQRKIQMCGFANDKCTTFLPPMRNADVKTPSEPPCLKSHNQTERKDEKKKMQGKGFLQ